MSHGVAARIVDHFAEWTDARDQSKVVHPLINLVTIALCAAISGADVFVAITVWANEKRAWLARFLDLSEGIPSHDRFNAAFAQIKPAEFEKCFLNWITALHEITAGQLVAIDGKTLRRSFDAATSKAPLHMVSAWAAANHVCLGQVAIRKGHADANFNLFRRAAPSLLKNNHGKKVGVKNKRLIASASDDYRTEVRFGA